MCLGVDMPREDFESVTLRKDLIGRLKALKVEERDSVADVVGSLLDVYEYKDSLYSSMLEAERDRDEDERVVIEKAREAEELRRNSYAIQVRMREIENEKRRRVESSLGYRLGKWFDERKIRKEVEREKYFDQLRSERAIAIAKWRDEVIAGGRGISDEMLENFKHKWWMERMGLD